MMNKSRKLSILMLSVLLAVVVSVSQGQIIVVKEPENGGVKTEAIIVISSDESTVGTVYRWQNIGSQTLFNRMTKQYESFNEHVALYPSQTQFYRKKVRVEFAVKTVINTERNRAFRATVRVDGTIHDSSAGIYPRLSDSREEIVGGVPDGEEMKYECYLEAYDDATIDTYDYVYFFLQADGQGDTQLTSGGGMEIDIGTHKNKLGGGVDVGEAPPSNVPTTHYSSDSATYKINDVPERPDEYKCSVPDQGLYGTVRALLCAADEDAGQSYTLPSSLYHWYPCPEGHCNYTGRWICYNTPCGHPWWWNILHDDYYMY